jgi:uncharacterized protein (DUF362 family)
MSAFVRRGDFVVVKPNAAWARTPEQAASTHPDVVAAVVEMCKEAGAGRVVVTDHPIDQPADMVFAMTGIRDASEKAGARVAAATNESMYRSIPVPGGKILDKEQVIKDVLKADVLINLAKAKVHSATTLTLGMKNLMGTIWNPQAWHVSSSLHQCIADFAAAVTPDLVIVDATRVLVTNGPKGPGETKDLGQVIAGTDQVAVDAYAATLFGIRPRQVEHIRLAAEKGLGEIDFSKVRVA